MRLKHITFTGIDERTNPLDLRKIQKRYPIAEFGILTSYHWSENGNRYLNPTKIYKYAGTCRLALHVCGTAAIDAAKGEWGRLEVQTIGELASFDRIQLNLAGRDDCPEYVHLPRYNYQEVIIQMKDTERISMYYNSMSRGESSKNFSALLDASGGRGIDTPIEVCQYNGKIGYAGGINPDNVGEKLEHLLKNVDCGTFWIDMESGVRTDDWFDVGKVRRVLEICEPIIMKYS